MTERDPLLRAIEALQAETSESGARSEATEEAIIRQLSFRARRRRVERRRWNLLIPLAAILFGSTAWAIVSPHSPLREFFSSPFSSSNESQDSPDKARVKPSSTAHLPRPSAPEPRSEVIPGHEATSTVSPPTEVRPPKPRMRKPDGSAPTDMSSENNSPAQPPPDRAVSLEDQTAVELALYQKAHRSQFHEHNFARALEGWDLYLATYPAGTLALEARYHRALCLVALGRPGARRALEPFARGDYGAYRRTEAGRLIGELDQKAGGSAPQGTPDR